MVIFNVFLNFLFIVKTFVADVANKKRFTINYFNLEIVLKIKDITFTVFDFLIINSIQIRAVLSTFTLIHF